MVDINSSQFSVLSSQLSVSADRCWDSNRLYRELGTGNQFSVPANRSFVQIDVDLLGLEIFLDAPGSKFSTKARLLVAAPWCFDIGRLHVIDPDDPGAQRLHRAQGFENIAGPDGGSQTVGRIVGDFERVLFVLERD